MNKITRKEIYKMTPSELRTYVDLHPEHALKIIFVVFWICIKISIKNFIKDLHTRIRRIFR